jgi:hypothetical protein
VRARFTAALRAARPDLDPDLERFGVRLEVDVVEPGGVAARGRALVRA